MKTYAGISIRVLFSLLLIGSPGDAAAQATGPSSDGGLSELLGLSPQQAKELRRRIESTVRERAVLESAEVVEIRSEVESPTVILRLVPDGSVVKAGDLLVELDDSALREELLEQQVAVATARATLRQAETATAAAEQERTHGLAVAQLALKVAELDRNKYLGKGGELELQVKRTESEIAFAQKRLKVAQDALKRAEQSALKGTADRDAADEAQLAAAEARAALTTAQATRQFVDGHLREHRTAALELAVLQASTSLAQIQTKSKLALENARAKLAAGKAALELEGTRLAAIQRQIRACRIPAPRDGLVIAAQGSRRTDTAIEEGAVVRQRQSILKMPDMSRLRVRVQVHESRLDRVRKGQPARIRFDAFPDRTFRGRVVQVADAPTPTSWFQGDVKEYAVLVSLEDKAPELKVGMTAEAEIDVSGSGGERR